MTQRFAFAAAALLALSPLAAMAQTRWEDCKGKTGQEQKDCMNAVFRNTMKKPAGGQPTPAPNKPAAGSTATDPCSKFGFFAADKKDDCNKKKGSECTRKNNCGGMMCPPPGYCWSTE